MTNLEAYLTKRYDGYQQFTLANIELELLCHSPKECEALRKEIRSLLNIKSRLPTDTIFDKATFINLVQILL